MSGVLSLAAERGKDLDNHRVAQLLRCDATNIEILDIASWTILRQGVAALMSRDIWIRGTADLIDKTIRQLLAREWPSSPSSTLPVYESSSCVSFHLIGFEEYGYFAGIPGTSFVTQESAVVNGAILILSQAGAWEWISKYAGCIVLVGTPNSKHRSYSLRHTPGTIYSDRFFSPVHAAETIVHEAAHNAFNFALEGIGVMEALLKHNASYYSPWRSQLRPAYGLLHAMYAFGSIEVFRRRIADIGLRTPDNDTLRDVARLQLARKDVDVCLKRVGSEQLNDLFDELYQQLELA